MVLTNCSNINCPWHFPEKLIPLYDDGANVRDWLYVEDHVDALLPAGAPHSRSRRYAIDPTRISSELGWQPRHSFEEGLATTMR